MRALLPGALALAGLLSACDFNVVPSPAEEVKYQVAPNRVPCPSVSYDDQPCLLVKRAEEVHWREISSSEFPNFTHETGYRYVLLVREQFRPPVMTHEVVRILEKTPDATIAVPGQP